MSRVRNNGDDASSGASSLPEALLLIRAGAKHSPTHSLIFSQPAWRLNPQELREQRVCRSLGGRHIGKAEVYGGVMILGWG